MNKYKINIYSKQFHNLNNGIIHYKHKKLINLKK